MSLLSILTYPHAILRKKAAPITVFDEKLAVLAQDMLETMYDDDAVGLAANQIGIAQRILVLDASEQYNAPQILINPVIIEKKGVEKSQEGCLSVPEIYIEIDRAIEITVTAQNVQGESFTIHKATGRLAHCIQHEIDHLDGVLFFDYLSPLKKQLIEKKLRKMACRT